MLQDEVSRDVGQFWTITCATSTGLVHFESAFDIIFNNRSFWKRIVLSLMEFVSH